MKKTSYIYENEPVLNISYHPIKLSLRENSNRNNKITEKSSLSPKYLIYAIIRHLLMPFYAYIRRVRCTSVYFELILSRWIKKFSDENNIPPSFNYLSFFITNNTNISKINGNNSNNNNINIHNDMTQATDVTSSSSSSVTSATLVSPSNYMTENTSNYRNNYNTYPLSPSSISAQQQCSSPQSSIFDRSNNGTLSWEDINSLVQHTLKTCLPEYYNPLADSVAILFFFASATLLTHLIYPRNRYRIYSTFWKYIYKFRREIYVYLGLRPNTSKSIIQVI